MKRTQKLIFTPYNRPHSFGNITVLPLNSVHILDITISQEFTIQPKTKITHLTNIYLKKKRITYNSCLSSQKLYWIDCRTGLLKRTRVTSNAPMHKSWHDAEGMFLILLVLIEKDTKKLSLSPAINLYSIFHS